MEAGPWAEEVVQNVVVQVYRQGSALSFLRRKKSFSSLRSFLTCHLDTL
jgi:hypothetical protein